MTTIKLSLQEAHRLNTHLRQSVHHADTHHKRTTPEKKAHIIYIFLQTNSITATAKLTHSGNQTVRNVLKEANLYHTRQ